MQTEVLSHVAPIQTLFAFGRKRFKLKLQTHRGSKAVTRNCSGRLYHKDSAW